MWQCWAAAGSSIVITSSLFLEQSTLTLMAGIQMTVPSLITTFSFDGRGGGEKLDLSD